MSGRSSLATWFRQGLMRSLWWPVLIIAVPLVWADFALEPFEALVGGSTPTLLGLHFHRGLVAAQVALLTIALVFGTEWLDLRWFVYLAVGALGYACWLAGFGFSHPYVSFTNTFFLSDYYPMFYWLPASLLSVQLPLWIAWLFGWRLMRRTKPDGRGGGRPRLPDMAGRPGGPRPRPSLSSLRIRHWLYSTVGFAAAMAGARLGPLAWDDGAIRWNYWLSFSRYCAVVALVAGGAMLPAIWFWLRDNAQPDRALRFLAKIMPLAFIMGLIWLVLVLAANAGKGMGLPLELATFLTVLSVGLIYMRQLDYRFVRNPT